MSGHASTSNAIDSLPNSVLANDVGFPKLILVNKQAEDKEKKVSELLDQYRQRPVLPDQEQQVLQQRVRAINHMAACEGWKADDFTAELDELYIYTYADRSPRQSKESFTTSSTCKGAQNRYS